MDIYKQGYKRFLADSRNPLELKRAGLDKIPSRTLYDIKSGKAKFLKLRVETARNLAVFYFPKLGI